MCSRDYFAFHGGCFSINTKNMLKWKDALEQCNSEGGTLAKISREGLRYAFTTLLEQTRPKPEHLHFGLLAQDNWVWIDGSPFNDSLWLNGYPSAYHGIQSCAVLSAGSSGIKNVDCRLMKYPLCQKKLGRFIHLLNIALVFALARPSNNAINEKSFTCISNQNADTSLFKL